LTLGSRKSSFVVAMLKDACPEPMGRFENTGVEATEDGEAIVTLLPAGGFVHVQEPLIGQPWYIGDAVTFTVVVPERVTGLGLNEKVGSNAKVWKFNVLLAFG